MRFVRYAVRLWQRDQKRFIWLKIRDKEIVVEPNFDLDAILEEDRVDAFLRRPGVDPRYTKVKVDMRIYAPNESS